MTKEQALAWKRRWAAVTERQRSDARTESYEDRFRSLASLMASTSLFDLQRLDEEDTVARMRWARLQWIAGKR